VANIQGEARGRLKLAKRPIDRAETVIFSRFLTAPLAASDIGRIGRFRGSSLPIPLGSAISPTFIARLIKGCRVDARAGCCV
jgi:hypothetical protein